MEMQQLVGAKLSNSGLRLAIIAAVLLLMGVASTVGANEVGDLKSSELLIALGSIAGFLAIIVLVVEQITVIMDALR
jgi:hypothetical protein